MKISLQRFNERDTILIVFLVLLTLANLTSLAKNHIAAVRANGSSSPLEPGSNFLDLHPFLSNSHIVGFLTDKDMSSERNDGEFLMAQYALAPIVLDLNNPHHEFIIFDCTNLRNALNLVKQYKATLIYVNPHGKVLAKRE